MSLGKILGNIVSSGASDLTKNVGDLIDKTFTSDDERLTHAEVMERIKQEADKMQVDINKIDAQSSNIFQAGWRPFIGWACGIGIAYSYVVAPILSQLFGLKIADLSTGELLTLVLALLGMTSTRTFEKMKGINK